MQLGDVAGLRAALHQYFRLFCEGFGHYRMTVPQAADRPAADQIQIFLAVFIPEIRTFAFDGENRPAHGIVKQVFFFHFLPV